MKVDRHNASNAVFQGAPLQQIKEFLISPTDRIYASIATKAGVQDPLSSPSANDILSFVNFKAARETLKKPIERRKNLLVMIRAHALGSQVEPYLKVLHRHKKNPNRKLSRTEKLVLQLNQHRHLANDLMNLNT